MTTSRTDPGADTVGVEAFAGGSMRAVVATRPGPPEVLELVELPAPVAASGQVLVAVELAATTFIDTMIRAGRGPGPVDQSSFPFVPGNGVAGRVIAVGEAVDPAWLGTSIVGTTGGRGGYASLATVDAEDGLYRAPDGVDLATAVALLADGRTALGLARTAAIAPGDLVAVSAAAGGVGSLLVQLAVRSGAFPVALAGGSEKLDHAASLGAAALVDYRAPRLTERLDDVLRSRGRDGFDVAFDGVGGDLSPALAARLVHGARYLPHGMASGHWGDVDEDDLRARGVRIVPLSAVARDAHETRQLVEDALASAAGGELRPTIGQIVPLADAAVAHAAMEARTVIGKTLLRV